MEKVLAPIRRFFAPRFIATYCFLIDRKLNEMGISQEGDSVFLLVRLNSIDSVREVKNDNGDISKDECLINYNGDTIVIGCNFNSFKMKLKKYGYL